MPMIFNSSNIALSFSIELCNSRAEMVSECHNDKLLKQHLFLLLKYCK